MTKALNHGRRCSRRHKILLAASLVGAAAGWVLTHSRSIAQVQSPALEPTLLTGRTVGPDGKPMAGVTISVHGMGSPVVASVFSDNEGRYYLPPLPTSGAYEVVAQAVGFKRQLTAQQLKPGINKTDFSLSSTDNFINQLSAWEQGMGLPEDTRENRRGKALLLKACSTCHQSSKVFTRRFDEKGWEGMIEAMPYIFMGNERAAPGVFKTHGKELAAYLAKVSGPETSPMKLPSIPRANGDALHSIVYTYAISNADGAYNFNLGNDWQQGNPLTTGVGTAIHDATVDMDGNVWFTSPLPAAKRTIGKIDGVTGKLSSFTYPGYNGGTSLSHAMVTAPDGTIWFTNATGPTLAQQEIGFMDPRTLEARSYPLPPGLPKVGGWLNVDGKNGVWGSTSFGSGAGEGALLFDRSTKSYKFFRSKTNGLTYGVAGDRDGNGWWTQINEDRIGYAVRETGETGEIILPFTWEGATWLKPGDMSQEEYISISPGLGKLVGNSQMPRRIKADLNADFVWVANFFGNSISRIDTKTRAIETYPLPYPGVNPYDVGIDNQHRVWVGLQNGDEIARFDPKSKRWAIFPLPIRGVSPRSLMVVERPGQTEVIVPATDAHQVVRLIPRTADAVAKLKRRYYSTVN